MKELSFKVSDISSSKEWAISGFQNTVQLSQLVNFRNEPNRDQEAQYLSLMSNRGVIRYEDKGAIGNKKPEDLTRCKRVCSGDLVVNSMNFKIGSFGISPFEGVVSTVYHVISPKQELLNTSYLNYWFGIDEFRSQAQNLGNGILEHRRAIREDRFGAIRIPLPPLETQQRIADYLDKETSEIDEMIENLEGLVEELEIRGKSIPKRLFDSYQSKKYPSTSLTPLWSKVKVQNGFAFSSEQFSPEGEMRIIRISDILQNKPLFIRKTDLPDDSFKVSAGNIVIGMSGAGGFNSKIWKGEDAALNQRVCSLKFSEDEVDAQFLQFSIQPKLDAIFLNQIYTTLPNLSTDQILKLRIFMPSINEQRLLASSALRKVEEIDEMISQCSGLIEDLKARRSALITEVVSGRKEV